MSYGALDGKQRLALAHFVRGKEMHDLGAGDLKLAEDLVKMGATSVHAYDKEPLSRRRLPAKVTYARAYFHDLKGPFPHIFLSWPANHPLPHLTEFVRKCSTIAYLGKNTDGSSCGHPDLFEAMLERKLLAYVPARSNSLILLGGLLAPNVTRSPTPEELAGLTMYSSGILHYEAVEATP